MANLSYKTKAFVLGSLPRGEANRVFILLTPDLGLIYAHGQGVRLEKSKLRFSLEDFSLVEVILVHGKTGWRITNASSLLSVSVYVEKKTLKIIARATSLVRKLVVGEDTNYQLYTIWDETMKILIEKNHTETELSRIEIVWVLKILFSLGYIDGEKLQNIISSPIEMIGESSEVDDLRSEAISQINRAIESSQLFF